MKLFLHYSLSNEKSDKQTKIILIRSCDLDIYGSNPCIGDEFSKVLWERENKQSLFRNDNLGRLRSVWLLETMRMSEAMDLL